MKIVRNSSWLSEENKDRFYRFAEFSRKSIHLGWIPFIMIIGTGR